MAKPMTLERLKFFRDWVDGKWPDGSKHVPDGSESWTAELVGEIERLRSFASEVAEGLSEYGNGTTDEEVCALRDLAFAVAPDWSAKQVPTRAELAERATAAERLAVALWDALSDEGGYFDGREAAAVEIEAMRKRQS